jgi:hypothetical protein
MFCIFRLHIFNSNEKGHVTHRASPTAGGNDGRISAEALSSSENEAAIQSPRLYMVL